MRGFCHPPPRERPIPIIFMSIKFASGKTPKTAAAASFGIARSAFTISHDNERSRMALTFGNIESIIYYIPCPIIARWKMQNYALKSRACVQH